MPPPRASNGWSRENNQLDEKLKGLLWIGSIVALSCLPTQGGGERMFKSLMLYLGNFSKTSELDKYEPIYGLPRRSLQEWLSYNPLLKKDYEAELLARSLPNRAVHDKRGSHKGVPEHAN